MKKKFSALSIWGIFFCVMIAGCGNVKKESEETVIEDTEEQIEESVEKQVEESIEESIEEQAEKALEKSAEIAGELSAEQIDAYEQMSLYIQEGFRIYGIDGVYQAYFGPIEKEEEMFSCDILLEGTDGLWSEFISYTVDEENVWYTFEGQDEPIFSKDSFWMVDEDSSYAVNLRENYQYKTQIASKIDLSAAVHYDSEGRPIEKDRWKDIPFRDTVSGYGYYVLPTLYTYQDERLNIDIVIEYPCVWLSDDELEEKVNEALRNAFFYGYYSDDRLYPESELYTSICRTYSITREDERYFSVRIYEDNYTRGANHPNEWEEGVTIDLQTGEVLRLEDVIGKDQSVKSLLESGVFESLIAWEGESTQDWINHLNMREEEPLSDYDTYFYLLDDGIGIITFSGRYYNCLEAKFEDLGIDGI